MTSWGRTARSGGSRPQGPDGSTPVLARRRSSPALPTVVDGLDALRAAAAVGIVFIHVYQYAFFKGVDVSWARAGDAGVSVFFVLSGYLITSSIVRPSGYDWRSFARRRVLRLAPLYFVSIAVTLFFIDAAPMFSASGRKDIAAHLFFVHGFFRSYRYSINGIWWTLTVEATFYVLVTIAAPWIRRRLAGWAIAVGLIATGLTWRLVTYSSDPEQTLFLNQQFPGAADLFGMGMAIALALRTVRVARLMGVLVVKASLAMTAVIAMTVALVIYHRNHVAFLRSYHLVVFWPVAMGLATSASILALIACDRVLGPVSRRTGLAWLGRVSFGIYLFHAYVISSVGEQWLGQPGKPGVGWFIVFVMIVVSVVAWFCHRTIEQPLMKRRPDRRPTT